MAEGFIVRATDERIVTTKLCIEAQVIARMVSLTEGHEYQQIEVVEGDEVLGYFLGGEGYRIDGDEEPMHDDLFEPMDSLSWDTREMTLAQWSRGYGEDKATQGEDGYAVLQQLAARYGVEQFLPSEQAWNEGGGY
jgi:hypothetical protein